MVRHWRSYLLQLTGIYLYVLPWDSVWFRASGPFEGTGFYAPPPARTIAYFNLLVYIYLYCQEIVWFHVIGRFEGTGFHPAHIAYFNLLVYQVYFYVLPRDSVIPSDWAVWRYWLLSSWNRVLELTRIFKGKCMIPSECVVVRFTPPSTYSYIFICTAKRECVIPTEWAVWRYWLLPHPPQHGFVLKSIVIPQTAFAQNHFPILPPDVVLVVRIVWRRWLTPP